MQQARADFEAGRVDEALEVYLRHQYTPGIVEAADHYFRKHNLKKATELYRVALHAPGLRRVLDRQVAGGSFGDVRKTLDLLFEGGVPPAEFSAVGRRFLEAGNPQGAEKAFAAANDPEGPRALAGFFLEKGDHSNALRHYRTLGDTAKIREIAGHYLSRDDLARAEKLFRETGDADGLARVADRRVELAAREAPDPEETPNLMEGTDQGTGA
ncbi:MAG: hypothetical protein KA419_02920 [Acidobacteria bacterium]|nr:hypothetical protein [Acidobacteriota bacterium]